MSKNALIMGIETSCDETAAAIIQDDSSGIPKFSQILCLVNLMFTKNLVVLYQI